MSRIATKLRQTSPAESFWYFSGRSSNEAGFLLQLFARLYGTNHVNNCSYYCHQASGVGLASAIGTGAGTIKPTYAVSGSMKNNRLAWSQRRPALILGF